MRALIDRYLDAYNRMDVAGMLATVHPQVVFENHAGGKLALRTEGREPLQELALRSRGLFSMRRQQITGYREHEGVAYAQIAFEGVFAMDLPNGVRAGQRLQLSGRSEYRQHEGLLIHIADYSE